MANITRYDPFNDLVDDFFKGFLVRPLAYEGSRSDVLPRVKVDVAEKNGAYVVKGELPGVKKEDIHVSVDGAQVTLEAEVKQEKSTDNERVLHTERTYGKVSRAFTLPQEIDEAKVQARFEDGVLELTLPKKQAPTRKPILIQ
jgi:HSP20 family protein